MIKRFGVSTLLTLIMFVSVFNVAYAAENISTIPKEDVEMSNNTEIVPFAGTEVWNQTEAYVGMISMDGNNLTPVKTIGRNADQLMIYSEGQRVVSNPNCKMEIQVRKAYTNTVLASSGKQQCGPTRPIYVKFHIEKGTQIQVYFRLYDLNGNYQDSFHALFFN